jgi:hypothetical protein
MKMRRVVIVIEYGNHYSIKFCVSCRLRTYIIRGIGLISPALVGVGAVHRLSFGVLCKRKKAQSFD